MYYPITKLDEITQRIIALMPHLEGFFASGDTILENSQKLCDYQPSPLHATRQAVFKSLLQKKIQRLFSPAELKNIRVLPDGEGLKGGVVDHHGILNHPVLTGVNITPHYYELFNRDKYGDILTFSTGNVPLNDPFHRRGFMIGGNKVNIFPKGDKNKIVYGLEKYDFEIVRSLRNTHQWKLHAPRIQNFLQEIDDMIKTIDFSSCQTLGDQITKINFYLWPLLFDAEIRKSVQNLITIEYDDVVIQYLLSVLENDQQSFVYRMLFDDQFRTRVTEYFNGKTGAWDEDNNRGTSFFWGLDKNHEHLRMSIRNGRLESEHGELSIAWNLPDLKEALNSRILLPGMFLKFALILFYMGLKPFAGYGSGNYLGILKDNLIDFLHDEYPEEAKNIAGLTVNSVTSVPVLLKRGSGGQIENYFAFDIMSDGGLSKEYFERLNTVPLKYFMAPNLNTMYEYGLNLYGHGAKEDILIKAEDYEALLSKVV